jgi:hypothetical protein
VEGGNATFVEEPGKVDTVYVLPGIKFEDRSISMWGDGRLECEVEFNVGMPTI